MKQALISGDPNLSRSPSLHIIIHTISYLSKLGRACLTFDHLDHPDLHKECKARLDLDLDLTVPHIYHYLFDSTFEIVLAFVTEETNISKENYGAMLDLHNLTLIWI